MQNHTPSYKSPLLSVLIILLFTGLMYGQDIDHWETIVETGQSVKYLVPSSTVPTAWTAEGFDDSAWTDGISGIGYEDDDDNTIIGAAYSVYVRYRFSISDLSVIESLILDMDFDDGFVAYLNGDEIARDNLGNAYSATTWNQLADGAIEELPPGSYRYFLTEEDVSKLVNGENILCIEVHNQSFGSSDLSSNTFLSAGINNANSYYNSTPIWFVVPVAYTSSLPIMVINTSGQSIPNDPRIVADMGLIYNGPGVDNYPDDVFSQYDGKISIEVRGSSSQMFPKKSYSIELQTDTGTNNNVSLLGLPRENDFVLNGPYSDKSLLRNIISYDVYEAMGHWAPRTRLIDLYINQDYRGIYVLTEKVKIDRYRVNIKQLTAADVSPTDISGGYILQIDRTDALASNEYWTSPVSSPISGFPRNTFEYSDPSIDELTTAQGKYIKDWTNNMDAVMASSNYKHATNGYRAHINVRSFVDYLILHEFNKDVDAYRLSTFFYKASDLAGGKLHAGPPWDYNLTFGNMYYGGDILETYNWMYPKTAGRYWWPRLMNDPYFENRVFCRWDELKETIFNETELNLRIDSCLSVMGPSVEQNFDRWPVLGEYVWPNNFIGQTYESEILFLRNWISERLDWLDNRWSDQCIDTRSNDDVIRELNLLLISPNPSSLSHTRIQIPEHQAGTYRLSVFDINGREVYNSVYELDQYSGNIFLEDLSDLNSGIYMLRILGEGKIYSSKLIKD
jgi:hypothetical protein